MELTTEFRNSVGGLESPKGVREEMIIRSVNESRLSLVDVTRTNEMRFQACHDLYPTFWLRPPLLSSGLMLNAQCRRRGRAACSESSNPWILGGGLGSSSVS